MTTNKIFQYIKTLSFIGIMLALYLLWEQFFHPSIQPCRINNTVNCDAIINGAVSKTFGLATPLYGLTGYSIILLASILRMKKLLVSIAAFGLVFCLWIGYQEVFLLHVICPVCILCQIIMITVFILGVIVLRKRQTRTIQHI